jgi:hypothetical protein
MGDEPKLADYAAVQDYLFSLKAQGLKFGIDRMRLLAGELGHPERASSRTRPSNRCRRGFRRRSFCSNTA